MHFNIYHKILQKGADIYFSWDMDISFEFINKTSDIKNAQSIKTFHFSTLYTNWSLDAIDDSLRSVIIIAFAYSK